VSSTDKTASPFGNRNAFVYAALPVLMGNSESGMIENPPAV
jgi:hypothetical protein